MLLQPSAKSRTANRRIPMTAAPSLSRGLHAVPVAGGIARDITRSPDTIRYALVILLTLLVLAVKTLGAGCPCAWRAAGSAGDVRAADRDHPGLTPGEMPLGPFACPALSVDPAAGEAT
jgi:hypothetical protein